MFNNNRPCNIKKPYMESIHKSRIGRPLWQTGIVQNVVPVKDPHIRSCEVRLANGPMLRPVQLLYLLDIID